MRTFGRVYDRTGKAAWVEVSTDANGSNSYVYLTTLIQCLKLNLGESPFYANYGIPAHPSVVQQIAPDFYVTMTQQQFAPFFASLTIAKISDRPPTYKVNVTTVEGTQYEATIAV